MFFVVTAIATGVNEILSRLADSRAKTLWLALANILSPTAPSGANLGALTAFSFGANHNDSRPQADLHPRTPGSTVATGAATTTATTTDLAVEATPALLATPSLRSLDPVITTGKSTKIDNIPASVFAAALLELATIEAGSATTDSIAQKLNAVATKYPGTPLAAFLTSIATPIADDLDHYIATISTWFDGQMPRRPTPGRPSNSSTSTRSPSLPCRHPSPDDVLPSLTSERTGDPCQAQVARVPHQMGDLVR